MDHIHDGTSQFDIEFSIPKGYFLVLIPTQVPALGILIFYKPLFNHSTALCGAEQIGYKNPMEKFHNGHLSLIYRCIWWDKSEHLHVI